ncbi:hypothetical protein LCGC14_0442710 [marine sediment metagenome]|uniref:Uncharacterized protein n=1 Tax=marine sediment metagenome TaxID=412755 RepID=A0A0F9V705_9ZZZZ
MSIYTEQHYKSIADLLSKADPSHPVMIQVKGICLDFADLFAADNPPSTRCWNCGDDNESMALCTRPNEGHNFGGFNREWFLEACGLTAEQAEQQKE